MKQYLECGKIVSTHGVHGEVRVQPWCDGPGFLLGFETLYFEGGAKPIKVHAARAHKNMVLMKLEGVEDLDAAAGLRGRVLYIDRKDVPMQPGEHFIQDLLGLLVLDADTGQEYGRLTDVLRTGANDVYEITGDDASKKLAPAIPDVVIQTDPAGGVIRIRPLKGLFDDEN